MLLHLVWCTAKGMYSASASELVISRFVSCRSYMEAVYPFRGGVVVW